MPEVSVIIPVYNSEKYVEKCICSVMAQTLPELEIIIINDGSIDESGKILRKLALESARKSRTKIISIKKRLVFECADIFFMMPPWKRNSDGDKKFLCFLQNLLIQKNKNQVCFQKSESQKVEQSLFRQMHWQKNCLK